MEEETQVRLITAQTQALTQVSLVAAETSSVLKKIVENQSELSEMMKASAGCNRQFEKDTFRLLVGIIFFLVLVVSGLMYHLNIKGGDAVYNAATSTMDKVNSSGYRVPHDIGK